MSFIFSKWTLFVLLIVISLTVVALVGKKSVSAEVHIAAPAERVWSVITQTEHYDKWNPVFTLIEGTLQPGQLVTYHFAQDENTSYDIKTSVKEMELYKSINQRGGTFGILTFNHYYLLESTNNGVVLTIREEYQGLGVYFWDPAAVQKAYETLCDSIKARTVEQLTHD